jgi:hypothetical protein
MWWMRVCIGQYVLVRPLSTLAAVVGELTGYYCLASWSPKFVHVWASAAITVSVTVAMYCVIRQSLLSLSHGTSSLPLLAELYVTLKQPLTPYQPLLKAACIKLVVFLMFWVRPFLESFS